MAASNLNLGKASGGILSVSPADGTTNTSLVLPASGTVVATDVAVTDNAIARYDGTTGKVQNSGVIIDDSGNVGIGVTPSEKLHINGDIRLGDGGSTAAVKWDSSSTILRFVSGTSTEIARFDGGNLLLKSGTGALGYGTGAGGTVTQLTSKSTAVTLNTPSGRITMNNAALAAGATVGFQFNNSIIGADDTVIVEPVWSASYYNIYIYYSTNGSTFIAVENKSATSRSDAIPIKFAIIKGATA